MPIEATRFLVLESPNGWFRWRLIAVDGAVIAQSFRQYRTEGQCLYDIARVMNSAAGTIERLPAEPRRRKASRLPVTRSG